MTIDEAIAHAREKAKEMYLQGMLCHANPNDDKLDGLIECGREQEQLAEWLELLKWYEQGMEDIPCESGVLPKDVYWAGYSKAIDDFANFDYCIICAKKGNDTDCYYCRVNMAQEEIAERLKAGGKR